MNSATEVFQPLQADDPTQVAGYRLAARLGAGGMGRVHLSHTQGGRPVAIKVVRPELADDQAFRRRFGREIKAARRVRGAYTAELIDADAGGGPAVWREVTGPEVTVPPPAQQSTLAHPVPSPSPTRRLEPTGPTGPTGPVGPMGPTLPDQRRTRRRRTALITAVAVAGGALLLSGLVWTVGEAMDRLRGRETISASTPGTETSGTETSGTGTSGTGTSATAAADSATKAGPGHPR